MTFKEGGAFDFAATYERIKETLSQALEIAREHGRPQAVDLSEINLEQLPAYEEVTGGPVLQRPTPISRTANFLNPPSDSGAGVSPEDEGTNPPSAGSSNGHPPPNEPPPGYEETQQSSVAENLEQGVRKGEFVRL